MKVRYPAMDFSKIRAHWSPDHPEFSQSYNAFSTVPAHIEPFLVKVMRKVQKVLDPKHKKLHEEVEIFNKQEMQHCKQHLAFNKRLCELGYEGMVEYEKPYKEDYERWLNEKSLRFNVAYCEGFEAMGASAAQALFEDLGEFLEGADEDAVNLWKWHLAEEFEHRTVCYDVYKTLYGNGPFAYLYRIYGLIYAVVHIGRHTKRLANYMLEKDRENMTADEREASEKRQAEMMKKVSIASRGKLLAALSPFYDPARKKMSPGMAEILAAYPETRQT